MHDGTIRYIGSGLLAYMLAPLLVLYGGLLLFQHSGPGLFAWQAGLNTGFISVPITPSEVKPPNPPKILLRRLWLLYHPRKKP